MIMVRILVNLLSPESTVRDTKKLSFDAEREGALLHIKHNWKWNHDIPDVDPKCFEVVWKLTEKLVRHYEGLVRGKVPWISLSRLVFAGKHKVLIFTPEKNKSGKVWGDTVGVWGLCEAVLALFCGMGRAPAHSIGVEFRLAEVDLFWAGDKQQSIITIFSASSWVC